LEDQVHQSITSTMQGLDPGPEVISALRAYLETLTPPVGTQANLEISKQQAGTVLFAELGCAVCHRPPSYTTPATYDVAIPDEVNHSRFNPPSLRGVSQRTNLFHDGRARSLKAVFSEHRHQLHRELSTEELALLVSFLASL
jgi:cytochrome c peroxidase